MVAQLGTDGAATGAKASLPTHPEGCAQATVPEHNVIQVNMTADSHLNRVDVFIRIAVDNLVNNGLSDCMDNAARVG